MKFYLKPLVAAGALALLAACTGHRPDRSADTPPEDVSIPTGQEPGTAGETDMDTPAEATPSNRPYNLDGDIGSSGG